MALKLSEKGGGVPFSNYGPDLIAGIDRSNRAQFQYHLVKRWVVFSNC